MAPLTTKGLDAPPLEDVPMDEGLFEDGVMVGIQRHVQWLSWPPVDRRAARILIVDDEKDVARWTSLLLKKQLGCQTACAYDGYCGLAAARALLPDLMLLNLAMPKLTGFEVLRDLRSDPATRHIKAILTSVSSRVADVARQAGAQDYLTKPFTIEALLGRVRRVLGA